MPKSYVTVYDLQMRKVALLENAFDIGYSQEYNALWTAQFSLPVDDEKNAECKPLYFVEIFDGGERLELFRILPNTAQRGSDGETVAYQCEHVLATLLDDVLFQYHTIGNLGVHTRDVLQYILDRQTVKRWKLGTVQFSRQFEYNWENVNLLGALFSVPQPFVEEYQWTWDTTTTPWTLNLVQPSTREQAYIRYGVNLQGISKVSDPSNVVTRLYGLGYGEGVNQLTFADINGGQPYIDAEPEYIAKYGIVSSIFVDRRYEYPETLLAVCQAMLQESKVPAVSYSVDAAEIYALTNDPIDRFACGAMVRVIDQEMGVDIVARVMKVSKGDVLGQPGAVTLEIANKVQDIAGSIANLRDRMYISQVSAQGSTNLDTRDFADNCDPQHPAVLKFYVPEETARINKVMLNFQTEPFRAYSKAIEGGGGVQTTSGPSSTQTTAAGGGTSTTTSDGGASVQTTSTTDTQTPTTSTKQAVIESSATSDDWDQYVLDVPEAVSVEGKHNHGIPDGTNLVTTSGETVTFSESGNHSHALTSDHRHNVTIPAHNHTVTIPGHNHKVDIPKHKHELTLPNHTHDMDHTHSITIPPHTHQIEYGIYEGPSPTVVTITVDGNQVPVSGTSGNDINIIPYLAKDGEGKITRGNWHEIKIAPNSLGRIVANVVTQLFVQSRGGGNY
ncbi:phage tail protein [Paenibacillus sp. P96]|uniref:Phage tail protein n=1 Tax=Paenibacillus zeirhizosphaerae TaxID=2987519 RepID=A0ABT9FL75_9BACL|nr:phage tail protein [Paenibacillus sp. P96]MDP4095483.1 phage tail protein [Paenibacillus sp. P96]